MIGAKGIDGTSIDDADFDGWGWVRWSWMSCEVRARSGLTRRKIMLNEHAR